MNSKHPLTVEEVREIINHVAERLDDYETLVLVDEEENGAPPEPDTVKEYREYLKGLSEVRRVLGEASSRVTRLSFAIGTRGSGGHVLIEQRRRQLRVVENDIGCD